MTAEPELEYEAVLECFSPRGPSTGVYRGLAVPVEAGPEHNVRVVGQRGRAGAHHLHGVQHGAGRRTGEVESGASTEDHQRVA